MKLPLEASGVGAVDMGHGSAHFVKGASCQDMFDKGGRGILVVPGGLWHDAWLVVGGTWHGHSVSALADACFVRPFGAKFSGVDRPRVV